MTKSLLNQRFISKNLSTDVDGNADQFGRIFGDNISQILEGYLPAGLAGYAAAFFEKRAGVTLSVVRDYFIVARA